jgi:hypothetical protein
VSLRLVLAMLFGFGLLYPNVPTVSAADFTQQVIELTNAERINHGLPPLTASTSLTTSAQRYSTLMATVGFFGHIGPDGSTLVQRDTAAGYAKWTYLAENIASGQRSPAEVVAAWLNSPDHRANLLSPRVREIGVGYFFQAGSFYGSYWVQEFGSRSGQASPRAAAPSPTLAKSLRPPATPVVVRAQSSAPPSHADTNVPNALPDDASVDPTMGQLIQFFQLTLTEEWSSIANGTSSLPDTIASSPVDHAEAGLLGHEFAANPALLYR